MQLHVQISLDICCTTSGFLVKFVAKDVMVLFYLLIFLLCRGLSGFID